MSPSVRSMFGIPALEYYPESNAMYRGSNQNLIHDEQEVLCRQANMEVSTVIHLKTWYACTV